MMVGVETYRNVIIASEFVDFKIRFYISSECFKYFPTVEKAKEYIDMQQSDEEDSQC